MILYMKLNRMYMDEMEPCASFRRYATHLQLVILCAGVPATFWRNSCLGNRNVCNKT